MTEQVNVKYCSVCKSEDSVDFVEITDCNLCKKCQNELADSFSAMFEVDREDYPEL